MDSDCHKNFRLTVCGTFLPKCSTGSNATELLCRETCFSAKRGCSQKLKQGGTKWPNRQLKCNRFRRKRKGSCLKPVPNRMSPAPLRYAYCEQNTFSACANLSLDIRTLPNMFLQSDERIIQLEMNQYEALLQSRCHNNLAFCCVVFSRHFVSVTSSPSFSHVVRLVRKLNRPVQSSSEDCTAVSRGQPNYSAIGIPRDLPNQCVLLRMTLRFHNLMT